jgi:hypothetical protein
MGQQRPNAGYRQRPFMHYGKKNGRSEERKDEEVILHFLSNDAPVCAWLQDIRRTPEITVAPARVLGGAWF